MSATSPLKSRAFRRAGATATRLVASNRRLSALLASAASRLEHPAAALAGVRDDLLALLRMMQEIAHGRYRRLPRRSLVAVVAGLLYLIDPLDLIPDFLPVLGLVDDAGVLWWVLRQVRRDLDQYLEWEREWGSAIDIDPADAPREPVPSLPAHGT